MKLQFGAPLPIELESEQNFSQMRSLSLKRSRLGFQPSCFFWSEKKLRQPLLRRGFLEAGGQLPSTSAGLEM